MFQRWFYTFEFNSLDQPDGKGRGQGYFCTDINVTEAEAMADIERTFPRIIKIVKDEIVKYPMDGLR